jgi:hypothetical protein
MMRGYAASLDSSGVLPRDIEKRQRAAALQKEKDPIARVLFVSRN